MASVQQPQEASGDDDELPNVYPVLPRFYRIGMGPKGRGLFAVQDIPPRTLLHVAPCIKVQRQEYDTYMQHTILEHYLFNSSAGNKMLALGDGSLFNHSSKPNVDYRVDGDADECVRYYAGHSPIAKGQELCISYGATLWFDDADGSGDSSSDEDQDFLQRLSLASDDSSDS
jgi:SET domain-containing protein